ncbi:PIN domain-containing protein [Algoriphagus aquimarinus]|uniref:PIN like domain-containing protein n=1 Tax=Algoriphagus aquimarinus TaxID=237018 RepID=A0A5C7AXB7_9BACT|nr:PIN domain-containing protein [Algoriphagus aquimarinus]TXE11175.1 hypothetical protein ESV85_11545 [Algoriphagus aquimarinus]
MKNEFIGYRRKTEEEIKNIWENGIICFDTNVLLNLYRYSDSTRSIILQLIEKLKDKVYLPYQVALEFNRNRYETISEQEQVYKDYIIKINQIQTDLQSANKPPFLLSATQENLNKVVEEVSMELETTRIKYNDYLKSDPIFDQICILFETKITAFYDDEKLNAIFKDGEERFKNKIPPGYEDEKDKEGNRKYGDLVLWSQIIELAKEKNKPVLLVTDERKKDWWWKIKDGRNMGPRQELISEIKEKSNVDFHMYSSERFLSYGQEFLQENVSQEAVKEIVELKNSDLENLKERNYLKHKISRFQREIREQQKSLEEKEKYLEEMNKYQDDMYSNSEKFPDMQEHAHNLGYSLSEQIEAADEIRNRIANLKKMRNHLLIKYSSIRNE